jgi:hypothetical protein
VETSLVARGGHAFCGAATLLPCKFAVGDSVHFECEASTAVLYPCYAATRFQFAARLSPTSLGGGMVAGDFLRPFLLNHATRA